MRAFFTDACWARIRAARLANITNGGDRKTDQCANLRTDFVSQDQAADMLNVSRLSVQAAAKVQQAGVPELAAALDAGTASVSAAAAVATLPVEQQHEVRHVGRSFLAKIAVFGKEGNPWIS